MSAFLLYHPHSRPTGRTLARRLGIPSGKSLRGRLGANSALVIRWGNAQEIPATYHDGQRYRKRMEINTRQAVALASSKYRALKALAAADIPVPEHTRDPSTVVDWIEENEDVVVFGRSFRHMQGRDINIIHGEEELNEYGEFPQSDYYTKYIKPAKEYRIHVFGEEILFAQKKYFGQELYDKLAEMLGPEIMAERDIDKDYIRNNEHGWRFYDVVDVNTVPTAVRNVSIRAVDALGLDFGAVDVISHGRDENRARRASVLEINTAPGLRDRNLNKYVEALNHIIQP